MIDDVECEIEIDREEHHGVGVASLETGVWHGSMTFKVEDDEMLTMLADVTDTPLVRVDAPSIGWHDKPFVPVDND